MNSKKIARELENTLTRYRAGMITQAQARQELAILQAMLKAQEQTVLEEKLDRIEAVLEDRR